MITDAPNINVLWADLIVEELIRNGATMFVLSPGSRSAPLAIAVSRNPRAQRVMHYDERGAAYFALGHAAASGRPAVLICTSGTAVANYLPAVVEASNAQVPLVVLTADRPPELLSTGANQTIDQTRIFGDYVRWEHRLQPPTAEVSPEVVLTTVDQAVFRSTRPPFGPVHVNCMFREPLAPIPSGQDYRVYLSSVKAWRASSVPYTAYGDPLSGSDPKILRQCLERIDATRHGLLVVGRLDSPEDSQAALKLARALNWPTLPDVTSGLRLGDIRAPLVHYYDQLLLSDQFRRLFRPQTILHLGGPITSKRYQRQIETVPPSNYILIAEHPLRQDPAHRVTLRAELDIASFCGAIVPAVTRKGEDSWLYPFRNASMRVREMIQENVDREARLTEVAVAQLVSRHIHEGDVLFLGNSMPIRDMDMYGFAGGPEVRVAANRGASGIDGTVATAVGWTVATRRSVTAIIGDLAALHDLSSFSLIRSAAAPLILVVINNNGGGIFSFLPVAEFPELFEANFGTPHGLRFEQAAAMFGLEYARPATSEEFAATYDRAREGGTNTVIEVVTDREDNHRLHRELQARIAEALESAGF